MFSSLETGPSEPSAVDRERYQTVKRLYHEAAGRTGPDREGLLRGLGRDDPALEQLVRELLHHADAETAAFVDPVGREAGEAVLGLPDRLGRYRLLRPLGQGGMGTVFEAVQEDLARRVALKVVRPGLDAGVAARRFRLESAALARLDHPGIATIHETGTTETAHGPRPWIAMELVIGEPLGTWAAARRPSLGQRLRLLLDLADAVAHAHERGVVHRDLKPGNVLVVAARGTGGSPTADRTEAPGPAEDGDDHEARADPRAPPEAVRVKVLDFGIARLLADDRLASLATEEGQVLGTLPYMSPEQVAGRVDALDARTDVYALGVMAYELLSGRLPCDVVGKPLPEAARIIHDVDPLPLGALDRRLHGDVETIVGHALEKDPARRYPTAADLASDLRRHLLHQPITARPPTTLYQLRKFTRRHRGLVAGLVVALAGLLAGSGFAWRQAWLATLERNRALDAEARAEDRAAVAAAVEDFLHETFDLANPERARRPDLSVAEALEVARELIDGRFADQPVVRAAALVTFGRAHAGLGRHDVAEAMGRAAAGVLESLPAADPGQRLEADALVASALGRQGRYAAAIAAWRDVVAGRAAQHGETHGETLEARLGLARALAVGGEAGEARALLEGVVEDTRSVEAPPMLRATALAELGDALRRLARPRAAAARYTEAMEVLASAGRRDDVRALGIVSGHAHTLRLLGRYDEAVAAYRDVLERTLSVFGDRHPRVAIVRNDIADALMLAGAYDEAEEHLSEALAIEQETLAEGHPIQASTLSFAGRLAERRQRHELAVAFFEAAVAIRRAVHEGPHRQTALALDDLGGALVAVGRLDDAEVVLDESIGMLAALGLGATSPRTALGRLLLERGETERAVALLREVLTAQREHYGDKHPHTMDALNNLGWALHRAGRLDEAEPVLREAVSLYRLLGADHPLLAQGLGNLAALLLDAGRPEEALVLLEEEASIREAVLGAGHPETAAARASLEAVRARLAEGDAGG